MSDDLMTLKDVAGVLRLGHTTTYAMAQQGRLPAFKVGGQWRVRRRELDAWLDRKHVGRPILYVEDDIDEAELTIRRLERHNVRNSVVLVHTAEAALDFLGGSVTPELMLLDLRLPGISGVELLRRVRADARTSGLPVVVLTSSDSDRDEIDSRTLGVNAYLRKPVDMSRLMAAVAALGLGWSLRAAQ